MSGARYIWALCLAGLLLAAGGLRAQEFSALARLDPDQSGVRRAGGGLALDLWLSQPVPWRVFTLDAPRRLVVDFREVDWRGISPEKFAHDQLSDVRFGALRPGWSRLVADLAAPLRVAEAGMEVDPVWNTAHLQITLAPVSEEGFAASAGAPPDPGWDALVALDVTRPPPAPAEGDGVLTVAIDAGHGGIDPGASRDGLREADLMLALARDLAMAVARTDGMRPVLIRDADVFVPLEARMTRARAAGADVFISLHADALEMGQAAGASIYTLSDAAQSEASARMAERHGRADLLAGLDLAQQDDTVAMVLMDLARAQTAPQSARLQKALIEGLGAAGARLNSRPARQGRLAVLMSSDFPSVLIEAGFLSNDADRAALQSPEGRAPLVAGLIIGLRSWAANEAALAPLMRQ